MKIKVMKIRLYIFITKFNLFVVFEGIKAKVERGCRRR